MMDINMDLLQRFIYFLVKRLWYVCKQICWWCCFLKCEKIRNQQLAQNLHKTIIWKSEKGKEYSFFKDNLWGAALAHMQLTSKFNKDFDFYFPGIFFVIVKWRWLKSELFSVSASL